MGGKGSGWKRAGKKLAAEDVQRVEALSWVLSHGGPILTRQTPTGGQVRQGVCSGCKRAVRYFYLVEHEAKCERCHGLTRATRQQAHTAKEELRHDPALLVQALEATDKWADDMKNQTGDDAELKAAVRILSAASAPSSLPPTAPRDALTSKLIAQAQVRAEAGLQERVVSSDIASTTALLEKVQAILDDGHENIVNRLGEPGRVPLTVSSLTKLIHAYVAVSNVRAARSGLATEIVASRDEGTGVNALTAALRASMAGTFDKDGNSIDELEKLAAGGFTPKLSAAAPMPVATGQDWEAEPVAGIDVQDSCK
jgi:hypothetical protein